MNMLSVCFEERLAAQEATKHRKHGLEHRTPERDYWYCHGDKGRSLLSSSQRKSAQHKTDKQASAVAKKDCRRVEIKTQKAEDCPGERQGKRGDQEIAADQRDNKNG